MRSGSPSGAILDLVERLENEVRVIRNAGDHKAYEPEENGGFQWGLARLLMDESLESNAQTAPVESSTGDCLGANSRIWKKTWRDG